ncbi:hypothetical protein [Streptomyces sp. Y1]|uniref:DUF402 domain-containing protein n=1 Tax=Streptomyces sp. Y1 TaxID=3238634 RepID=A0AB39TX41_9ACTN
MEELRNITSESLNRFLTRWYGSPDLPISTNEESALMPPPLRLWHETTSRWSAPTVTFNHPLGPNELEIEDGKLVFWVENQGCWTWSTDISGGDPMVFDRRSGPEPEVWIPTGESLSEFLLHATVFEAIAGAPYQMYATNVTEESLSQIICDLHPLPLPRWRWPSEDVRILFGSDLLAQVSNSVAGGSEIAAPRYDVSLASPYSGALARFSEIADIAWKHYVPTEPVESSWDDLPDFLR